MGHANNPMAEAHASVQLRRKQGAPAQPGSTCNHAPGDLLTDRDAAAILTASVQTLRNWRWRGEGPRYRKLGKRMVRYARADLLAFIEGTDGAA